MANSNWASTNIVVFPAGRRDMTYLASKVVSEQNLTQLVKSVTTTNGTFIIKHDSANKTLEFCLEGYYIKLSSFSMAGQPLNVWASLDKDVIGGQYYTNFEELKGDSNGEFKGLILSDSAPQSLEGSIQLIKDGSINSTMLLSTLVGSPYIACPHSSAHVPSVDIDPNKLWIDTSDGNVIHYYNGTSWQPCGAVYK